MTTGAPQSPCTLVCTMDRKTGQCLGCFRTIDEIARWSTMGDAEKRAVLALVAQRGAAAALASGGTSP
ncbi:DUF1289 domain-containing protein [Sphingomonas sp. 3P27F8]|uniref:DUF1289 domain-containing protein n=1 Tax=Sphingomonas sp. 3P27F8 TaxID=2502213 RepID=UPI0020167B1D|nr:DUF1289 domain-containing protein [Sphingomonas sp. 3P27F8]